MGPQGRHEDRLRHLPLEKDHALLGARFAPFAGWRMPTMYESIIDEHMSVRTEAGLFDVSHMGRLLLRGVDAVRTVRRLVAGDISALTPGQARYTVLLTPQGGILDDLIVYRRDDGVLLIVNASNLVADREWLTAHLVGDTVLDDLTEITALFALQGPRALDVLTGLTPDEFVVPPPFTFAAADVAGVEATVMRTGYTGEDGVELMVAQEDAVRLWRSIMAAGGGGAVTPCGLGARDTLRLEAALLLHGNDIDRDTTPFEARLHWLVDLERVDGSDFTGREALARAEVEGPRRLLVGLTTDARSIPRAGDALRADGRIVGRVTSGSLSPVLGRPIALGYVEPPFAKTGGDLEVAASRKSTAAKVVARPFYKRGVTPVPPGSGRAARNPHKGADT